MSENEECLGIEKLEVEGSIAGKREGVKKSKGDLGQHVTALVGSTEKPTN